MVWPPAIPFTECMSVKFHSRNRYFHGCTQIHNIHFVLSLQKVCVVHSARGQSSNVATWVPLVCCHGTCITIGTQRGSLFYWGLDSRLRKDSNHTVATSFHDHLPSYPQIPIPSVQVRTTTGQ